MIVIAYDLWQIWKSRPQSCQLQSHQCAANFACAQPKEGAPPRCLPKPTAAPQLLEVPFAEFLAIQCTAGSEFPGKFSTDYSLYGLELKAYPPVLDLRPPSQNPPPVKIFAPARGKLVALQGEIRILLGDGYYLSMRPITQPKIQTGEVNVGDEVGILDPSSQSTLMLTAHYLNVDLAEQRFAEPDALGLSVPFQLKLSDEPARPHLSKVIRSDQLVCDPESEFRLFRVTSSH